MPNYQPPLEDIRFLLETFDYPSQVASLPRFRDFDLDTAVSLLEAYGKYCVDVLAPLNRVGDTVGVKYNPASKDVTLPPGFKEAYAGFRDNGFVGLVHPTEYGGMGAPFCLSTLGNEMLIASNKSFSMSVGLASGLIEALTEHGSEEQRSSLLPMLVSGQWAGTMCLTEPQCGTDLGLLTTRAEPSGDHYVLTGTKIWITFGEHDLTENIIHLVLARLPDAPPGIKGISTFVVPKVLPDGRRNPIFCGGTDHKMGINASPTCVMNLEGAHGWLVGAPHRGMPVMFTMMNAARLHVGIEGVALGEASYQAALSFAKDRRQSRALSPARQEKGAAADNILVHPDVRRMLLNIRSTTEALRGLVAWISVQYDIMHNSSDPAATEAAGDLVALLTPIIKSYGSERGFANISEAMQVTGGSGYTRDWPIEQHLRDERIAMIYEGTNHIQALDLVGRKLPMHNGRLLTRFNDEIRSLIKGSEGNALLAEFVPALAAESKRLGEVTMTLGKAAATDPEVLGAAASNYLNQFALVTLAYVWARQIRAVSARPESDPLRRSKLQLARYFYKMVLPEAEMYARKALAGPAPVMEIDVALL